MNVKRNKKYNNISYVAYKIKYTTYIKYNLFSAQLKLDCGLPEKLKVLLVHGPQDFIC